jgi:hypothetical protein
VEILSPDLDFSVEIDLFMTCIGFRDKSNQHCNGLAIMLFALHASRL